MVVNFEVGKIYRYNGKIGDPSPFLAIDIEEQDALFIVSGKPLVCTYVENHSCPFIKFEGMSSARGWILNVCYHLFDEVAKDKYVPAKKFETGKWYVCHLNERPISWSSYGGMDGLLDGKPHKCVIGNKTFAGFEDLPDHGVVGWSFHSTMDYFEEVPAPSSKVDWGKKYAELEKRYNKLKGMFVEYLMDEDVEFDRLQ